MALRIARRESYYLMTRLLSKMVVMMMTMVMLLMQLQVSEVTMRVMLRLMMMIVRCRRPNMYDRRNDHMLLVARHHIRFDDINHIVDLLYHHYCY